MPPVFDVPANDRAALLRWMERERPAYGQSYWFRRLAQVCHEGDWGGAWALFAHVRKHGTNQSYLNARTPKEGAAALTSGDTSEGSGAAESAGEPPASTPRGRTDQATRDRRKREREATTAYREWISDALDVDLRDTTTPEVLHRLAESIVRQHSSTKTESLLRQGADWARTREGRPGVGSAADEPGKLRKDMLDLMMDEAEYDLHIALFAAAVRRQTSVSRGVESCPVCGQYVVDPTVHWMLDWLGKGIVNVGRALVFLFELGIVIWFGLLCLMLLETLTGVPFFSWIPGLTEMSQ